MAAWWVVMAVGLGAHHPIIQRWRLVALLGIYARKFGLSKKGLLQIDYSCSWNDLDRVMQRHY
ncbi:GD15236 [Drosophila simulans]|uniref:GD15236 n=1 Tax=Drosophila simulans TaxID=7240 RepID=B4NSH2_DROSI|nr:GD15236 [Drosophila simulans]